MLRDKQDPSLFVFFEVWADKAALDVHSALPHMTAFFEKRMDYGARFRHPDDRHAQRLKR